MKKIFLLGCLALFTACQCSTNKVEDVKTLNLETTISMDREDMYVSYKDYKWFESEIVLKDYLNEECDGTIENITNVFQITENDSDAHVILITHTPKENVKNIKHGFWVGDQILNNEEIKLTFKDAFEKVQQSNYPKPHSRQCVLRKELGPKPGINTQYVFGNQNAQLYVDAVTGDVTNKNPNFDE